MLTLALTAELWLGVQCKDRLDRILDSRFSLFELTLVEKALDGVSGKSCRANETTGEYLDPFEGVPFRKDIFVSIRSYFDCLFS